MDPDDDVGVLHGVLARGVRAHAVAAAGLVGEFAGGVELAVAVFGDVDGFVGKLGALVVEAVLVREHLLERGGDDLVGDGFAVYGVLFRRVLDDEPAVLLGGGVEATGFGDDGLLCDVACSVRIGYWVGW